MKYYSYSDLANTIRANAWKVPQDIDLIVGIPRSGMIAALMLGELLNKPVIDLQGFVDGKTPLTGLRGNLIRNNVENNYVICNILVLDDSVFNGTSMDSTMRMLSSLDSIYNIKYACVYAEGKHAKEVVDIYFEDNYTEGEICFYEWNILHHYESETAHMMFDMDGVLCKEPPDERNVDEYEKYIEDAIPIVVPTTKIGAIVTYRYEKYREVTENWLKRERIDYGELVMCECTNNRSFEDSAIRKAKIYKEAEWAKLFVESSAYQARLINKQSGKPVFCYEDGKMYE